jgi:hypothetical protein
MESSSLTVPTSAFAALSLTQNSTTASETNNLTPHKKEDVASTFDTPVSDSKNAETKADDEEDDKLTLLQALD